jgi:hypothetical protein
MEAANGPSDRRSMVLVTSHLWKEQSIARVLGASGPQPCQTEVQAHTPASCRPRPRLFFCASDVTSERHNSSYKPSSFRT